MLKNVVSILSVLILSSPCFGDQQVHSVQYIDNLQKKMNEQVLGQPEAVDAFIDLEKTSIFSSGERQVPELIFLLGLPGTGKDTSVEAYIRAKHSLTRNNTNPNALVDHIFNVPKLLNETDLAVLTGSKPGYVGSEDMPPLLSWLVKHSGGKYKIEISYDIMGKKIQTIKENPDWKPGQVLNGYFAPEEGVLFVNELHDWKKEYKNLFLKEALEKGKFVIGNAKNGLSELFVPVTMVLASNDGIDLVADRDIKGRRIGKSLSFEQLMSRWTRAIQDPSIIKRKIKDVSEEVLNRIPNSRIVLMRPMSKETIMKVVRLKFKKLSDFFSRRTPIAPTVVAAGPNQTSNAMLDQFYVILHKDFEKEFFLKEPFMTDARQWIQEEIKTGRIVVEKDQAIYLESKPTFSGKNIRAHSVFFVGNPFSQEIVSSGEARLITYREFIGGPGAHSGSIAKNETKKAISDLILDETFVIVDEDFKQKYLSRVEDESMYKLSIIDGIRKKTIDLHAGNGLHLAIKNGPAEGESNPLYEIITDLRFLTPDQKLHKVKLREFFGPALEIYEEAFERSEQFQKTEVNKDEQEKETGNHNRNSFPNFKLQPSEALIEFLGTYQQLPDEGARSVDDRIQSGVQKTIQDAYFAHQLKIQEGDTLALDIQKNTDGTYSLLVNHQALPIQITNRDKNDSAISDARIDELIRFEENVNARVKGVQHIVKKISKNFLSSANIAAPRNESDSKKGADLMMFLGVSSTGKTELAKSISKEYFKTSDDPKIIDCREIQSDRDLRIKFLGDMDSTTHEPIPSEFMKEWDRHQGEFLIVLDEFSNAHPQIQTALYNILREPVVRTFSDGKPRPMNRVKIVMTGNTGEEWYKVIPRDIPEEEQYQAAREIYERYMQNSGSVRGFLQKHFSEAFLARVGLDNIYFFGPHSHENIYDLIHLKLSKSILEISKVKAGSRSWNIRFKSQDDYRKLLNFIALQKFNLWEQGASINHAVEELAHEITYELLKNKIPPQSTVFLELSNESTIELNQGVGTASKHSNVKIQISVSNSKKKLSVSYIGKPIQENVKKNPDETRLTAYHEAGHEITRKVLLGEYEKSEGIKITSGIAEINGQMIRYAGLASASSTFEASPNLDYFVRRIAVLMGGTAAESLVTRNSTVTAGKSNDIQRATSLAQQAILRFGLMPEWGNRSLQPDQSVDSFLQSLSAMELAKYEKALSKLLRSGEWLAKKVLVSNFDQLLIPMGNLLTERGELSGKEIESIYGKSQIVQMDNLGAVKAALDEYSRKLTQEEKIESGSKFYSFVNPPRSVIDVNRLLLQEREEAHQKVDLSSAQQIIKTTKAQKNRGAREFLCSKVLLSH